MQHKEKILHIKAYLWDRLVLSLGIIILIVILDSILNPFYINLFLKDLDISVSATSESNSKALANNVRLSHIIVNGKEYDLSTIRIPSSSNWQYDQKNDFLYSYSSVKKESFSLMLPKVHTLSFVFIAEKGSGIAEININGKTSSHDLYKNTDWEEVSYDYETSLWVFPEGHYSIMIGLILITITIVFVLYTRDTLKKNRSFLFSLSQMIIVLFLLAGLSSFLMVLVQYKSLGPSLAYISDNPQLFLRTTTVLFFFIGLACTIAGRLWIGFFSASSISVLLAIINNIKLVNRGVPLLPWDVSLAGEALSVAKGYRTGLSAADIFSILIIFSLTLFLFVFYRVNIRKISLRIILSASLLAIMSFYIFNGIVRRFDTEISADYRVYQIDKYYEQRGFLISFLEYLVYMDPQNKPDGYGKEKIESIASRYPVKKAHDIEKKPNIIVVMSESFWDVSRLDSVNFEKDPLPNFHALQKTCLHGSLFTHVLNGGTVNSEFEFLTGFSTEFFPEDYIVYGSHIKEGFFSAVSTLNGSGYKTLAIHPYIPTNYNRENCYNLLGFDQCYFENDFKDADKVRGYVSDQEINNFIINEYKNNRSSGDPLFVFAVTMQNHGGYWEETTQKESVVPFETDKYGDVAKKSMNDYFAGLNESDRALGQLINYFNEIEDDTIIIFFGDHMSDAGPKGDRMLNRTSWADNEFEYDYQTHLVPFLVWSNYDTTSKDAGLLGVNQLLPLVSQYYDIPSAAYWDFLNDMRSHYAATDSMIITENNYSYRRVKQMDSEELQYYNAFRLLQYDYIWGRKYASRLWETKK